MICSANRIPAEFVPSPANSSVSQGCQKRGRRELTSLPEAIHHQSKTRDRFLYPDLWNELQKSGVSVWLVTPLTVSATGGVIALSRCLV
jgi:hypothetical protein